MPPAAMGTRADVDRPGGQQLRATPPAPPGDPTHGHPRGPINAAGAFCWQNGRDTEDVRRAWAAGARGNAKCCPDCTAPLVWNRSIGGELVCWGCTHSDLPLRWRRHVVQLWLTGAKASAIAETLGTTKSAVLSYRRRARLPGRGSPLIGCDDSQANRARKRRAARIAKLPAAAPPPRPERRVAKVRMVPQPASPAPTGGAVSATETAGRPKGSELPRHAPRHGFTHCQYITGTSQFCDDATAPQSPYCTAHTQLCFVARRAA
jgi:hypothetical protein